MPPAAPVADNTTTCRTAYFLCAFGPAPGLCLLTGFGKLPHALFEAGRAAQLRLHGIGLYATLVHLSNRQRTDTACRTSYRELARITGSHRKTLRGLLDRFNGTFWTLAVDGDRIAVTLAGSELARVEIAPGVKSVPAPGSEVRRRAGQKCTPSKNKNSKPSRAKARGRNSHDWDKAVEILVGHRVNAATMARIRDCDLSDYQVLTIADELKNQTRTARPGGFAWAQCKKLLEER